MTHKEDIESLVVSPDMEKGLVHVHEFDDDYTTNWYVSFRNLPVICSRRGERAYEVGNSVVTVLASLSSFVNKYSAEGAAAEFGGVHIQSFGGEAYVIMFAL